MADLMTSVTGLHWNTEGRASTVGTLVKNRNSKLCLLKIVFVENKSIGKSLFPLNERFFRRSFTVLWMTKMIIISRTIS